jgi:hypothetical protein
MTANKKPTPFNIIKFKGSPTTVTLYDGTVIQKSSDEFVYVPEYYGLVRKAPYDNHFLFELPKKLKGPSYMCSCGSAAVFIGSNAYAHLGSREGMMLVCHHHTTFNVHADGAK